MVRREKGQGRRDSGRQVLKKGEAAREGEGQGRKEDARRGDGKK